MKNLAYLLIGLYPFLSIITGLVACNNGPINTFKLEGVFKETFITEVITLDYYEFSNNEWRKVRDTAEIINGTFFFEGKIDELTAATLYFDEYFSIQIFLEPTTMKLQINENHPYAYELTGTKIE
jgi:hypothetical protein